MKLSEYIRHYRTGHDLSLRAFAEKCGCSYQYIDRLEKETIEKPSADMLKKIASAMGMSLQDLLSKVDDFNMSVSDNNEVLIPINFSSAQEAISFIIRQPMVADYGGYDLSKMSDEDIVAFANEIAGMIQYAAKLRNARKEQEGEAT